MSTLASTPAGAAPLPEAATAAPAVPPWVRSAALRAAALAGFCLFLAALFASQIYLGMLTHGHDWWRLFLWQAGGWSLWGLAAPAVLALGRRLRLERGRRVRNVLAHAAIGVVLAIAHLAPVTWLTQAIDPYQPVQSGLAFSAQYRELIPTWFPLNVLVYWGILGAGQAWHYYRRFRERELRASQLEALLARAELQALKLQLHPHFLFNSLNAVAGLVRRGDNPQAVRMLAGLSDLLRYVLDNAERQTVLLGEELEFIRRYLEIQQLRFGDRLASELAVEPTALAVRVPNLVLQPLVENALEHGVAGRGRGRIRLTGELRGGRLLLAVEDDGAGLDAGGASFGVGLENTRARLEQQYGGDFGLELALGDGGGVVARLDLPAAPEPDG